VALLLHTTGQDLDELLDRPVPGAARREATGQNGPGPGRSRAEAAATGADDRESVR
ncbi:hypothetical protein G3I19_33545, partial [Streptomyces sp. SID10853]|nr:hypothetical protein [Streptomyces sp. SID10853]